MYSASGFKKICITNRHLCSGDFLEKIKNVAASDVHAIILREKDMHEDDYYSLASKVKTICADNNVEFIAHNFVDAAKMCGAAGLHLPLPVLASCTGDVLASFNELGTSCHSLADLYEAQQSGCTYIVAGHIFKTDSKKGLPPRGVDFLKQVVSESTILVYAIGGISEDNLHEIKNAGAAGACMMREYMR